MLCLFKPGPDSVGIFAISQRCSGVAARACGLVSLEPVKVRKSHSRLISVKHVTLLNQFGVISVKHVTLLNQFGVIFFLFADCRDPQR